jgi:hypothetical protein
MSRVTCSTLPHAVMAWTGKPLQLQGYMPKVQRQISVWHIRLIKYFPYALSMRVSDTPVSDLLMIKIASRSSETLLKWLYSSTKSCQHH